MTIPAPTAKGTAARWGTGLLSVIGGHVVRCGATEPIMATADRYRGRMRVGPTIDAVGSRP